MGTEGIWFKSSFFSTVKFFIQLKSIQFYFKLTQLIGGTFPRHFLKNLKQKSKRWHNTRKRTSWNSGCHKKKFKISEKSSSPELGQIVVKLAQLLNFNKNCTCWSLFFHEGKNMQIEFSSQKCQHKM